MGLRTESLPRQRLVKFLSAAQASLLRAIMRTAVADHLRGMATITTENHQCLLTLAWALAMHPSLATFRVAIPTRGVLSVPTPLLSVFPSVLLLHQDRSLPRQLAEIPQTLCHEKIAARLHLACLPTQVLDMEYDERRPS